MILLLCFHRFIFLCDLHLFLNYIYNTAVPDMISLTIPGSLSIRIRGLLSSSYSISKFMSLNLDVLSFVTVRMLSFRYLLGSCATARGLGCARQLWGIIDVQFCNTEQIALNQTKDYTMYDMYTQSCQYLYQV